jgi:hypothetical protein
MKRQFVRVRGTSQRYRYTGPDFWYLQIGIGSFPYPSTTRKFRSPRSRDSAPSRML